MKLIPGAKQLARQVACSCSASASGILAAIFQKRGVHHGNHLLGIAGSQLYHQQHLDIETMWIWAGNGQYVGISPILTHSKNGKTHPSECGKCTSQPFPKDGPTLPDNATETWLSSLPRLQAASMGQEMPFCTLDTSTITIWAPMVLIIQITVPLGAVAVNGVAKSKVPGGAWVGQWSAEPKGSHFET